MWSEQRALDTRSQQQTKRIKLTIPPIRIDNVVSTFKLNKKLDLGYLAKEIFFLEYNSVKFTAATMRLAEPRTTALTFASGSVVCTGGKSIPDSIRATRYYTQIFQRADPDIRMLGHATIQNIVASASCGFTLRLADIAKHFGVRTSFQMAVFPGLVFRVDDPKIVFLVFRSGAVVITGANTLDTIHRVFRRFYANILLVYRDTGPNSTVTNSAEYKQILLQSAP